MAEHSVIQTTMRRKRNIADWCLRQMQELHVPSSMSFGFTQSYFSSGFRLCAMVFVAGNNAEVRPSENEGIYAPLLDLMACVGSRNVNA